MSIEINGVLHGAEYLWPEGSEWDGPPDMKRLAFLWGRVREWQAVGSPVVRQVECEKHSGVLMAIDESDTAWCPKCSADVMAAVEAEVNKCGNTYCPDCEMRGGRCVFEAIRRAWKETE